MQQSITTSTFIARCFVGIALTVLLSSIGCTPKSDSSAVSASIANPSPGVTHADAPTPARKPLLVVAIDRSGSTDAMRNGQLTILDNITKYALANNLQLYVWAFDSRPVCIWGPRIPGNPRALQDVKAKELAPDPSRRITRPALLLTQLAADPQFAHAPAADIVILSDGDSEDANDRVTFIKTGRKLGTNTNLRLCLIGVSPESRPDWQKAFADSWDKRFVAAGPSEADDAIHQFLQ